MADVLEDSRDKVQENLLANGGNNHHTLALFNSWQTWGEADGRKTWWITSHTEIQSSLQYSEWMWSMLMTLTCLFTLFSRPRHLHHQISVGHGKVSNQTVTEKHLWDHLQGMLANLISYRWCLIFFAFCVCVCIYIFFLIRQYYRHQDHFASWADDYREKPQHIDNHCKHVIYQHCWIIMLLYNILYVQCQKEYSIVSILLIFSKQLRSTTTWRPELQPTTTWRETCRTWRGRMREWSCKSAQKFGNHLEMLL